MSTPLWPSLAQAQSGGTSASLLLTQRPLQFPRDLGSHPDTAIEWWYVTGELQSQGRQFGFQLTFFRSRVPSTQAMMSAFAAKQLVFAHAAVTDVAGKRLLHDQRIARMSGAKTGAGAVDLAGVSAADTAVHLREWSLTRGSAGYLAKVAGKEFAFDLTLNETQPLLLQGDAGWSRKGPQPAQASMYYSLPQLIVSGQLTLGGKTQPVTGRAWLDHEWSHSLLHPEAVGWDWIGMNLLDGSALTAFRLRKKNGETLWAGGSWRNATHTTPDVFGPLDVVFTPGRTWKSSSTGTVYPVEWQIAVTHTPANTNSSTTMQFTVKAIIDNQELDSRQSTGAIYWEGLSDLFDHDGKLVGRGYLEMTGYTSPLML
jgi:predicted secreted hydrolase